MGLKSLVCVLLILLSFPISQSNSTSSYSKQATLLHGHHVDTVALNHDEHKRIHSYIRKGHGKGGGANSASHHTPDPNRKSRASILSQPSSLISFMLLCSIIFGFGFFTF